MTLFNCRSFFVSCRLAYPELVGGALVFSEDHFLTVNGYSNMFWGYVLFLTRVLQTEPNRTESVSVSFSLGCSPEFSLSSFVSRKRTRNVIVNWLGKKPGSFLDFHLWIQMTRRISRENRKTSVFETSFKNLRRNSQRSSVQKRLVLIASARTCSRVAQVLMHLETVFSNVAVRRSELPVADCLPCGATLENEACFVAAVEKKRTKPEAVCACRILTPNCQALRLVSASANSYWLNLLLLHWLIILKPVVIISSALPVTDFNQLTFRSFLTFASLQITRCAFLLSALSGCWLASMYVIFNYIQSAFQSESCASRFVLHCFALLKIRRLLLTSLLYLTLLQVRFAGCTDWHFGSQIDFHSIYFCISRNLIFSVR